MDQIQINFNGKVHPLTSMRNLYTSLFPNLDYAGHRAGLEEIRRARKTAMESSLTYEEALGAIRIITVAKNFRDGK